MAATLATAMLTFAATNIDDIFVLALFFSQSSRGFRTAHIVAGQYLGFSALVAISLVGFFGGKLLPQTWVGLLGFVPILIGIRRWLHRHDPPVNVKADATAATTAVAGVTFANGADNIGVYTPLFASSDATGLTLTLLTFYVLLAIWCFLGRVIALHPVVGRVLSRYGHIVVPFVFVGLGIYILVESGAFALLRAAALGQGLGS
jgi:cadmium resistance transport/sequestration family protein